MGTSDEPRTFGRLLRQQRLAANLTQEALAERAGVGLRSVQALESGTRLPLRETLEALTQALELVSEQRARLISAAQPVPRRRNRPPVRRDEHPKDPADGQVLTVPNNLPIQWTSFVGREQATSDVLELLESTPLLTLTGTGGCGKTRLAIEMAKRLANHYPDGVWLIELAPLTDPTLIAQLAAATLGVREVPGEPILATLTRYLRAKCLFLVLDNCEHVIDAAAQLVEAILRSCSQVRVLVTSREALRITGEVSWRVPSLAVPTANPVLVVEEVVQNESVRLFAERARAVLPGFTVMSQNAPGVVQICQQLDGIPLALELAAAWVSALTPEQIAGHLSDRFRLLATGSRTALPRHQTLRALIDWSYDLLSEPERVLFRRLAVFVGGWTLDAAEAVCTEEATKEGSDNSQQIVRDEVVDLLGGLVDKSLVGVEATNGAIRYRFLETIRAYAGERLDAAGEGDRSREHHLAWYVALAERAGAEFFSARQVAWLTTLKAERANLRVALEWGLANNREAGPRLVGALWRFCSGIGAGPTTEGIRWLEAALPHAPEHSLTRAKILLGIAFWRRGWVDRQTVRALTEESLALFRELGDRRGSAWALVNMSMLTWDISSFTDLCEESTALFQAAGDQAGVGMTLRNLGNAVAFSGGDRARGRALMEQSLELLRPVGDCWNLGWTLWTLGNVIRHDGENERASELLEESLRLFRAIDDYFGLTTVLFDLAMLAALDPDDRRVWRILRESIALAREGGQVGELAYCIVACGIVLIKRGTLARGLQLISAGKSGHPLGSINANQLADFEASLAVTRATLGDDAFDQAWAEGRALTLEQAVAYALEDEGPAASRQETR
jgi:predicted ATPase/transcriptional regulator with XRE-family HTH domain